MDERRDRIHDDLRGIISGELYFEILDRAPYAHDASLYEIDPLGIVVPMTEEDVATVVRYAAEHRIPVHARGAGTDPGGGSLGPGLVIDFSRHLRKIVTITSDHVVVEPGVVPDVLNHQLAPLGRRLKPVPLTSAVSTIGGLIGVDSAGTRSLRFGSVGDQVERLRVVLAQGDVTDLGFEAWPAYDDEPQTFTEVVVRKLQNLYRRHEKRLEASKPEVPRNRAGYAFAKAVEKGGVDLARLVCGSEGTLALVLQAVLRTVPLPVAQGVVVLPFGRLADAAECVPACLEPGQHPSACNLFDWRSLSLARDADSLFRESIHHEAESALIVEFEGGDAEEVGGNARLLVERLSRSGLLIADAVILTRRSECDRLVALHRVVEPLMMRYHGRPRPISLVDEVAVRPDQLAAVLRKVQELFKRLDVSWTVDACAGEGRLRLRPYLDPANPEDRAKLEPIASAVFDVVLEAGGTISGSGGCGLARTQFLHRQYGDFLQTFREIKDAFDPSNLLNPGKVIGDDPHLMVRDLKAYPKFEPFAVEVADSGSGLLRVQEMEAGYDSTIGNANRAAHEENPVGESFPGLLPVLRWPDVGVLEAASACHGCGECRTLDPTWRMCPSFRALRREAASPRSQANLIRQVASGEVDPRLWGREEFKAHADLCIHCKMCKTECPAGIDVSSLMIEAKAAFVENHGLPPGDWVFSRLEMWVRLASRVPIVSNFLMSRRETRWLLERLLGVSRHRVLPPVQRTPFTRRAARLGLNRSHADQHGPRVVYFLDVYANYYDHELANAVVAVLQQAEVGVYIPTRQRSSGMAPLIVGDIDYARDLALQNIRVLANAVRDGFTVVCSEPTAALMLRQEYVKLTDDLDAALVAENTMDIGQYLLGLDARGQLPRPHEPLHARIGYHQPCHLRALDVGLPGLELIRKIPELDVEFINRGCSGMGGTYGLGRDQFRNSLRAGRELLKRIKDDDIEVGATECGACRIQMEQGVTKRTLHPIKLLSLGYGLNPSLRQHFKDSKPRHVMS